MENQHRAIKGYRELSQKEIDLMNRVKTAGASLLALHSEITQHLTEQYLAACAAEQLAATEEGRGSGPAPAEFAAEVDRLERADSYRWAAIGKTDVQTGIMALVRAVAQPDGV
jgi:hypothetical protein